MRITKVLKGFTLIELLIVVAIIAILAAIAVPNFLEAQTRAKVSRAKNDLRCLATALESYRVDYNSYPENQIIGNFSMVYVPNEITTPIQYATEGCLYDVFRVAGKDSGTNPASVAQSIDDWERYNSRIIYHNTKQWYGLTGWVDAVTGLPFRARGPLDQGGWFIGSYGPDLIYGPEIANRSGANGVMLYDPTNGTISPGDVVRTQLESEGTPGRLMYPRP